MLLLNPCLLLLVYLFTLQQFPTVRASPLDVDQRVEDLLASYDDVIDLCVVAMAHPPRMQPHGVAGRSLPRHRGAEQQLSVHSLDE